MLRRAAHGGTARLHAHRGTDGRLVADRQPSAPSVSDYAPPASSVTQHGAHAFTDTINDRCSIGVVLVQFILHDVEASSTGGVH